MDLDVQASVTDVRKFRRDLNAAATPFKSLRNGVSSGRLLNDRLKDAKSLMNDDPARDRLAQSEEVLSLPRRESLTFLPQVPFGVDKFQLKADVGEALLAHLLDSSEQSDSTTVGGVILCAGDEAQTV